MDASVLSKKRIGVALTGSFCTFELTFDIMRRLSALGGELFPILSDNAYGCDTRFYPAADVREVAREICGRDIWHTLAQVEPIGPKGLLDLMLVMPCTGNTLAKLAGGISDTPVTMACKSHLRNERPVLLAISTNDGLAGNAGNIGSLLNRKNVFFVPFRQDDAQNKPNSLVFDQAVVEEASVCALEKRQIQPVLRVPDKI